MPERDLHHPRDRRDHQRLRRPGLVVLAAVVVTLLLAGGGVATAAWLATNAGTATARAGQISSPTGVAIGAISCTTAGLVTTATIPVSWNAVGGAGSYTVESSRPLGLGVPPPKTVTGTSTTVSTTTTLGVNITVTVSATAGTWTSAPSAGVTKSVACPAALTSPRSGPAARTQAPAPTTAPTPAPTSESVPAPAPAPAPAEVPAPAPSTTTEDVPR